jgi:NAD(P)-dependent dehydrogenase (short-subunit alcohol dehydrogenase family)
MQAYIVAPTVILTEMDQKVWGEARKRDPIEARIPSRRFGQPIEKICHGEHTTEADLLKGQSQGSAAILRCTA